MVSYPSILTLYLVATLIVYFQLKNELGRDWKYIFNYL